MTIGRLERVELREVWPHEALDFTTWLQNNVEVLSDELNITIANVEREQAAGSFNVDLVGEDEAGNPVVIENQLERSDHDHLGKLITYLTAFEARTGIWIVSDPRPEHIAAVAWLNQSTPAAFYLLKVEAVRIGDSLPAPLLTRIVGPSVESREVGQTKKDMAEREVLRLRFFTELLDRARLRTDLHAHISPRSRTDVGVTAGRAGLSFYYFVHQHAAGVYFAIDGKEYQENKHIFDMFEAKKCEIQATFGAPLDWNRYDDRRLSTMNKYVTQQGYRDPEEDWPEIQNEMIEAMIQLEKALRPHIDAMQD